MRPTRLLTTAGLTIALALPASPALADPEPATGDESAAGQVMVDFEPVTDDESAAGQVLVEPEPAPDGVAPELSAAAVAGQSTAAALIAKAASQVGVTEWGSNCTPYGPCAAWCHYFAAWVGRTSGNAGITPQTGYTPSGASYFAARGAYSGGNPFSPPTRYAFAPKPGDYVYFWKPYQGRVGHVGIVEWVNGSTIGTIEGNSSNRVARRTHRWGPGTNVHGFGRPAYADAAAAPASPQPHPGKFPLMGWQAFGHDPQDRAGDTLVYGNEGALYKGSVAAIQRKLGLPQTGYYDVQTKDAVLAFEVRYRAVIKTPPDGAVGPTAWTVLFGPSPS